MKKLPQWDYKPSPNAGLCLAGVALVSSPLLAAVGRYGMSHKVESATVIKDGITYTLRSAPMWTNLIEIGAPLAAVLALILLGRLGRYDVGLTVGKPRVSFIWIAVGIVLIAAVQLGGVIALIVWVRMTDSELPPEWLNPAPLVTIEFLGPVLLSECIVGPVREELLYRGVNVPALERVGGPWLAILGSAVIFALGHDVAAERNLLDTVGVSGSLLVRGMVLGWVFLKTRSLAVVISLHSVDNLFVNVQRAIMLCHPDFVRGLFLAG